jgi:hypothetical protein
VHSITILSPWERIRVYENVSEYLFCNAFPLALIQVLTVQVISKTTQPRHCERSEAISQDINLYKRVERLLRREEHPPRNDGKVFLRQVLVKR